MAEDWDMESGRRIDRDFGREDIKLKAKIISSEYKEQLIPFIEKYDFSLSAKITLTNIVNVLFDPNAMLARNAVIEIRLLQAEVALNLGVAAMDASDRDNPGMLSIEKAIMDAFGDFVSPSIGGKERDRITKYETVSHQSYSGLPSNDGLGGQQGERRGFRLWGKS